MLNIDLDVQLAVKDASLYIPGQDNLTRWVIEALVKAGFDKSNASLSLRIVDKEEIIELNSKYRNKQQPTNVLSFPYEALPDVDINLLGDIVVCASVMEQEASEQMKSLEQHWAHIIVHGVLHLIGYDHLEEDQAEQMESLEIDILSSLGIPNPYGEINTP